MIRLLPFILVPVLIVAGLGYWRFVAVKQSLITPQTAQEETSAPVPQEVPKTLSQTSLEERIKNLEDALKKQTLASSVKASSPPVSSGSLDTRLAAAETAITDLKAKVAALEKATPQPAAAANNYPLYIPLGSGGGPWGDRGWYSLNEYQVSINSGDYPNYTSMQLEVNFRLGEISGTGSVRLYNVTDSTAVSGQADTTANTFTAKTSNTFKLSGGQKTYTLQVKSSEGVSLYIQSARLKVNF